MRFLGIRWDVRQLMNAAGAYVMSFPWEGMPMVLLEALVAALPIVATDVGGNREVVVDGESGFLVPARDHEALAAAMLRLMSLSEEAQRRMGVAGRRFVEANYALDQVVDQWEELHRELLARKGINLND